VSVSEQSMPAGWSFDNLVCIKTDVKGVPQPKQTAIHVKDALTTVLDYGEVYDCTATNFAKATVTVTKTVLPASWTPWTVPFKISPVPAGETATKNATDSSPTVSWSNLTPGTKYTITETNPAGFTAGVMKCGIPDPPGPDRLPHVGGGGAIPTGTASFTPGKGDQWTCSVTDIAPPRVYIQKVTEGGSGGPFKIDVTDGKTKTYSSQSITTSAPDDPTPSSPTAIIVAPGIVRVTESGIPSNYIFDRMECVTTPGTRGSQGNFPLPNGSEFELAPGDVLECTIYNEALATVQVTKTVQGNTPWSFNFTISPVPAGQPGTKAATNGAPTVMWVNLLPGEKYTITEVAKSGYIPGTLTCSTDEVNPGGPSRTGHSVQALVNPADGVTPHAGENVTCQVTNTELSKLTVTKVVTHPQSGDNWSFTFVLQPGNIKRTATKASPTVTFDGLDPSVEYTISEETPTDPRYHAGGMECAGEFHPRLIVAQDLSAEDATEGIDFRVAPGHTVTCTATNDRLETDISVTKTPDVTEPVSLGATVVWTITVTNNGDVPADNVEMIDNLPAALDLVSVSGPAGWDCSGSVTGSPGTAYCTKPLLAPGEVAVFLVTSTVNATVNGEPIINAVTVKTSTDETRTDNNVDQGQIQVADLPATGANTGGFLAFALALLGAGAVLQQVSRRRRRLTA
jgi:uncharacterized repeat protein (TIGR01451 family)